MIGEPAPAAELDRPSRDTGVTPQFLVECGTNFPLIGELEALLREAVIKATADSPLRHNSVENFDEYNTGKNVKARRRLGRSSPIPISAAFIPIWQAAVVLRRGKRWC